MPITVIPRDEQNAKLYPELLPGDRQTIFSGWSNDAAARVCAAVLDYIGDEVGRMVKTTEIAWTKLPGLTSQLGRMTALSALAVLAEWGFVANLGMDNSGRYIYARTTKSTRLFEIARHESWLRTIQARARRRRDGYKGSW